MLAMNPLTLTAPSRTRPLPTIVQPHHEFYDRVRLAWNLAADQRPAAVAVATTVEQVQEAVAFAREHGLRIAPQSTGHLAIALPSLEDALLLKTHLHDEVEVDPDTQTAYVKAGAIWEDVVTAAAPYGLTAPHGSSPDVGVTGYVLGGGLSFYAREHGLAANHVLAIDVVTADGEHRRVHPGQEPDLFWALRGGGGNFGVVTGVVLSLLPYDEVFAGALFWPAAEAENVLRAWMRWTRTAPTTITTSARLLRLPPLPEVPEPLRDVPVVTIDGVFLGDEADGAALIEPLRAVAPAMIDTWATVPAPAVMRLHGDPEEPVPALGDHALLGDLDDDGIAAFVAAAGEESGSVLLAAELRQLGGAASTPPAHGGARGALDGNFALFAVGVPVTPEVGEMIEADLERLLDAMAPWANGRVYLNFAEKGGSAERAYAPETYARLREIRAAYDPDEVFVASHRIAPAEG